MPRTVSVDDELRNSDNWLWGGGQSQGYTYSPDIPNAGGDQGPSFPDSPSPTPTPQPPSAPPIDRTTPPPSTSLPPSPTNPEVNLPGGPETRPEATAVPTTGQQYSDPQQGVMAGVQELGLNPFTARGHLDVLANWLKTRGFPDALATGEDTIRLNGVEYDILSSGNQWIFIRDTPGGGGGGTAVGGGATSQALLDLLQKIIEQNSQPMGDVSGTPAAMAYQAANQRGADFTRSALAERLAAEGQGATQGEGGSGALTSDLLGLEQAKGERQAQYEAQLSERLLTDRQNRLLQALQLGMGYMTDQQRIQLQAELQQTNSALDYLRITLGATE